MIAARTLGTAVSDQDIAGLRFLYAVTGLVALLGLGLAAGSLLASLGPSAEVLVTRSVDLSDIAVGERRTVHWKGYSVFIAHRTPEEIAVARSLDRTNRISWFGVYDRTRVQRDEWLLVIPRGSWRRPYCGLLGQEPGDERGKQGGWYDPCSGESFDTSGRSTWCPEWAWCNLDVPSYRFISDTEIEFPSCFPYHNC